MKGPHHLGMFRRPELEGVIKILLIVTGAQSQYMCMARALNQREDGWLQSAQAEARCTTSAASETTFEYDDGIDFIAGRGHSGTRQQIILLILLEGGVRTRRRCRRR